MLATHPHLRPALYAILLVAALVAVACTSSNPNPNSSDAGESARLTATTAVLAASPNPANFGAKVTLTASVSSTTGTPSGTVLFADGADVLGVGALDAKGKATFDATTLAVGSHALTAVYLGSAQWASSTSAALAQVIVPANGGAAVASSSNPSTFGAPVTFTATVIGPVGAATPTGTVIFLDGAVRLGKGTLDSAGQATLAKSDLEVGTHAITVAYGGDDHYSASTSDALSQVVGPATPAVALTAAPNPSLLGQSITLSVSMTAPAGVTTIPTGSVSFLDGTTTLGTATLDATGAATFSTAGLAVGTHALTAAYAGDSNFAAATSAAVSQAVGAGTSGTSLTSSANPAGFGDSVTFTAVVSGPTGSGTPTGTVTFADGTTALGEATLAGSGTATFTTTDLAVGSHSITAAYAGDANFTPSQSPVLAQVIDPAAATITLASSGSPSLPEQPIVFSVTVASNAGSSVAPTGTVTLTDGTTTLNTATLDTTGAATIPVAGLAAGTHTITATYSGDGNYAQATATLAQVVDVEEPSITLAPVSSPSQFGEVVSFNVVVTAPAGVTAVPTGDVTLIEGTTSLASAALDANGRATVQVVGLAVGTHSIAATYDGDVNFGMVTSDPATQQVDPASTTVTLIANPAVPTCFQSFTLTANVSSNVPGAGMPTGSVHFGAPAPGGFDVPLDLNGTATSNPMELDCTQHVSYFAAYSGDTTFAAAQSPTLLFNGTDVETLLTLAAVTTPVVFGQSVSLAATFATNAAPDFSNLGSSSSVSFFDGPTLLGQGSIASPQMVATFTTSGLSVGAHTITASFTASDHLASTTSNAIVITVGKAATTVAVTASASATKFGQPVTFTATPSAVAPGAGSPTGTVAFMSGSTPMGTALIDPDGSASLTYSGLPVGASRVTATYSGDGSFAGSTSGAYTENVGQSGTNTTISADLNPEVYGQTMTLTATVGPSAPGTGIPSGVVTFHDGPAIIGTGTLDAFGSTTLTTAALTAGTHPIIAIYGGDASFLGSTSGAFAEIVNQAATTTSISQSPTGSFHSYGLMMTYTATVNVVAPGSGAPQGTVSFMDGSTLLGTVPVSVTGTASVSTTSLSVGDHHYLYATYNGDANHSGSQSGNLYLHVNLDDTKTVVASDTNPSLANVPVTFTATVTSAGPFNGTVPTGNVEFSGPDLNRQVSLDANGVATLAIAYGTGTYDISAKYEGDGTYQQSNSNTVSQVVTNANATVSLNSNATPSVVGQAVTFTATVAGISSMPTGTVTFYDGTTTLGSATLSSGTTTFSTSSLALGTHTITATYNGETNVYDAATSGPFSQVVGQPATTVSLTSSVNPSIYNQSVTFTAKVTVTAPGAGTPTGTIVFHDSQRAQDVTVNLDSTGTATMTTSTLAVSDQHWTTATYSGDTNFATSQATLQQVVNTAPTTTTLIANPNPSAYDQNVTFTATVASSSGTPTGTVLFLDGATTLGSGTLDANGKATLATTLLAGGTHAVVASYQGDTNFATSQSSAVSQVVNTGATRTTLTTNANPLTWGQAATLVATVIPQEAGAALPTGTVTFNNGPATLGSATVDTSGNATLTTTSFAVGPHTLTAVYGGDGNYSGSTGLYLQAVKPQAVSVVITSTPNPSNVGVPVTFTVQVVPSSGTGVPTGTVSFSDALENGGTPTTLTLDKTGTASLTLSDLVASLSHSCIASYSGDADFASATSATYTQEVYQPTITIAPTDPTLSAPLHVAMGQTLSMTATLTNTASPDTDDISWSLNDIHTGSLTGSPVVTRTSTSVTSVMTYQAPAAVGLPDAVTASAASASATLSIKTDPPLTPNIQPFPSGSGMITRIADIGLLGESLDGIAADNESILAPYSVHGKFDSSSTGKNDAMLYADGSTTLDSTHRKVAVSGNLDGDTQEETVELTWDPTATTNAGATATLRIIDPIADATGKLKSFQTITPTLLDGTTPMTLDVEPDCATETRAWETRGCTGLFDYDVALADIDGDGYDEIIVIGTSDDPLLRKPGMMWVFDDMKNSGSGQLKLLRKTRLDGAPLSPSTPDILSGVMVARVAAGHMRQDASTQIAVAWIDSHTFVVGLGTQTGNINAPGIQQLDYQIWDANASPFVPLGAVEQTDPNTMILPMSGNLKTTNIIGIAMADVDGDGIQELVLAGWGTGKDKDSGSPSANIQLEVRGNLTQVTDSSDPTDLPLLVPQSSSPVAIHVPDFNHPPSRWLEPLNTFADPSTAGGATRVQHLLAGDNIASIGLDTSTNAPGVLWNVGLPSRSSTINGTKYSADDTVSSLFDVPVYYWGPGSDKTSTDYPNYIDVRAGDVNGDGRDDIIMKGVDGQIDVWGWLCTNDNIPCSLAWTDFYIRPPSGGPTVVTNAILAPTAVDADSTTVTYTGQHSIVYTNNTLIALLAAPPTLGTSINDADTGGTCEPVQNNGMNTYTGFSSTSSQSTGGGVTAGLNVGALVGVNWEQDAGVVTQTEIAGFEATFTAEFEASHTSGWEHELEIAASYGQGYGDDGVIFSTVPYDHFVYTMTSSLNPNDVGKTVDINIPQPPQVMLVDRTYFNTVVNAGSFQITKDLLKDTANDLTSYPGYADFPTSKTTSPTTIDLGAGYVVTSTIDPIAYAPAAPNTAGFAAPVGTGSWNGPSITVSNTSSSDWEENLSVDAEFKTQIGLAVFGGDVGFSVGGYQSSSFTNGVTFESYIGSLMDATFGYDFRLEAYKQTLTTADGKTFQSFYVANYGVNLTGSAYTNPPSYICTP